MAVDAGKPCRANQLSFRGSDTIGFRLNVTAFSSEAQVDDIHLVPIPPCTHQDILRFDVTVNDILRVNILKATEKLVGKHQDCLEGELAMAEFEEVLQTRSQKVEHHNIIFAFEHVVVNAWNTDTASKRSIEVNFSFKERFIFKGVFEFHGDLFAGFDVGS